MASISRFGFARNTSANREVNTTAAQVSSNSIQGQSPRLDTGRQRQAAGTVSQALRNFLGKIGKEPDVDRVDLSKMRDPYVRAIAARSGGPIDQARRNQRPRPDDNRLSPDDMLATVATGVSTGYKSATKPTR